MAEAAGIICRLGRTFALGRTQNTIHQTGEMWLVEEDRENVASVDLDVDLVERGADGKRSLRGHDVPKALGLRLGLVDLAVPPGRIVIGRGRSMSEKDNGGKRKESRDGDERATRRFCHGGSRTSVAAKFVSFVHG